MTTKKQEISFAIAFFIALASFLLLVPRKGKGEELDLQALYHKAISLDQEAALKIRASQRLKAEERVKQAEGSLWPKLQLDGQHVRQDRTKTLQRDHSTQLKLQILQPLYRGGAEWAALEATQLQVQAQEKLLTADKLRLYREVADVYYRILQLERELKNFETFHQLAEDRAKDIKRRVSIGRSRKTEELSALAQVAQMQAQVVVTRGRVLKERKVLAELTGAEVNVKLTDPRWGTGDFILPSLEQYQERLKVHPELQAALIQVRILDEDIRVQKAGHFPQVDVAANYYLKRQGAMEGSDWDLGLYLTFPLFQGRVVESKVRESAFNKNVGELAHQQQWEHRQKELISLHQEAQSLLQQRPFLERALELATQTYEQQKQEYQLGLVTQLEVLSSLNSYLESKRQLDQITIQLMGHLTGLDLLVGKI